MTQILHIPKIIFGVSRTYYKTPLLRLLDTKIRTLLDRGTVSDVDGKLMYYNTKESTLRNLEGHGMRNYTESKVQAWFLRLSA